MTKRGDSEGSIYERFNKDGKSLGWAGYVWVTTPAGLAKRKYVYGKTYEIVREKWLVELQKAKDGPVATTTPTVASYMTEWLTDVIKPNREPLTYSTYETFYRLHIAPWIGTQRLSKLRPRTLQTWLNKLARTCQCCQQGIDIARSADEQKCCAKGECCDRRLSARTVSDVRGCLRSALSQAIVDEYITKNPAELVKLPSGRKRRKKAWTSEEACQFLEHVRDDRLYAAYVLVLVMGLRKGEVLGLTWDDVDLEAGVLEPVHQLQRVSRSLIHKRVKTEESENELPLPDICVKALKARRERQENDKTDADAWVNDWNLVFTSKHGAPIEPRNFNRYFDTQVVGATVRRITVHDARRTCASLLVDLDVHPRVIMAILRHADFDVTMEIYAQASTKAVKQALTRLGESLDT